jgi:formylglycine-generating enzyme required for sulfatase activity/uncharacterized protein YjbI with pentapeptide repeats
MKKVCSLSTELLNELEQHQLWLTSGGKAGSRASFSLENLTGLNLEKINLTNTILYQTDFSFSNLESAILVDGWACAGIFESANISHTDFTKSELIASIFKNATGNNARFVRANIREASFESASLIDADFQECICLKTDFNNANLSGVNFANAILAEASFQGANLLNTNFTGSVMSSGTSFQAALNLDKIIAEDIKYEGKTYIGIDATNLINNLDGLPSLAKNLRDLSQLLLNANEYNWSQPISNFAITLDRNISTTYLKDLARRCLNFFGGAGTLNDIVLSRNGIPLIEENNRLDALRTEIYAKLVGIITTKSTGSHAEILRPRVRSSVDEETLESSISSESILQERGYANDLVADIGSNETELVELESQETGNNTISIDDLPVEMRNALFEREFEIVNVDSSGNIITPSQIGKVWVFREPLGKQVDLELVAIPGGKFMMGSPDDEIDRDLSESPQHEVTIQPFFMGRYPITQAQWRFVADLQWESIRELDPDPAYFKGDNLPVENISWWQADEFCERLSIYTGRTYRLPREAEWEYACRAGTTTAFYFGETISTDLANYDGTDDVYGRRRSKTFGSGSYASGSKGTYRAATNSVGEFPPNAFGLSDLHGNVMEWCLDLWEKDYQDARSDGRGWGELFWIEQKVDDYYSVTEQAATVRGGSWDCNPLDCRSAWRDCYDLNYVDYVGDGSGIGFRVVCEMPIVN